MNKEVKNMLSTIAIAKAQYFRAIKTRLLLLVYCITLVIIIGKVRRDIETLGSITKVNNAIAEAGKPIPKNPLIIPANTNINATAMVILMS